jgi:hypothetical protein
LPYANDITSGGQRPSKRYHWQFSIKTLRIAYHVQIKKMKTTILLSLLALTVSYSEAQTKTITLPSNVPIIIDSTKKSSGTDPKAYSTIITDKAITRKGMITTHKLDDKFFFEIADSILGRDILVVSRIGKSSAEVRQTSNYAGDQINSSVIRFEKGPNNKIFMRKLSFKTYGPDSTASMFQSLQNSNIQAIAAAFNIAAYTPDKNGVVIDMTDYLNGDNDIFYFSGALKAQTRIGALQTDKSYINSVRSFPKNVEIVTTKTYAVTGVPVPDNEGSTSSTSTTLELNTSLVILPKVPMQPRYFDPRVGYFTVGYTDFNSNPQGVKELKMVKRWRLEPKPEDLIKYNRGELVEPATPIVYYIDPSTPKEGDSTWNIDDATHSAIVYMPSEIQNAFGPSIADPRSGEILESHIMWYHNIMKLLHDWYFIQASVIDPRARKMEFSDELMGDLIRFVSSHEVGHTLGLLHNFGASSTVPVELLRNKAFVEANGHTPSIMDYARFNYVAQPEDHVSSKGIYPRIGDYDEWAIEWGYRVLTEAKTAAAEVPILNKITVEKAKNRRLWFGRENNYDDPHSQSEDLGDNAMLANSYGIKNLKVVMKNLPEWTKSPDHSYEDLQTMYTLLVKQFGRYMAHVAKNIGGIYETLKTAEQPGQVYASTPAVTKKAAVAFLAVNLFATPTWLLDKNTLDKIGESPVAIIGEQQRLVLGGLFQIKFLTKLINAEAEDGERAYKVANLFGDLQNAIFSELKTHQPIDVYRRNLQKTYVDRLIDILHNSLVPTGEEARLATSQSDIMSVIKMQLRKLDTIIKSAITHTNGMGKYHLQDLSERINMALNPK